MISKKISRFFWLGIILLVIFSLAFHSSQREWNQDLGRHLKVGEIILKEKSIPKTNLFSYVQEDFPFQNHHWLSEVIFVVVYNTFGNNGLILLKTVIFLLIWGSLFWFVSRKIPAFWAVFLAIFPILVFRERTDIRPEIFGLLFFTLFLIILAKARDGKRKWLWCLFFLQLLWVNLHISFVFGLFLVSLNLIENLYQDLFIKKRFDKETFWPLVAAIVINILNPFFLEGFLAPFLIWKNYNYQIVENQSVFFLSKLGYKTSIVFFKIGLVLGLTFFSVARKRFFGFLGWIVLSLISAVQIRHFPFWALYSFWFWGDNLDYFLKKISGKARFYLKWGIATVSLLIMVLISFVYLSNFYYRLFDLNRSFGFGGDQPAKTAVQFLIKNFPQGNIFNNFDIGSYLDYFYPQVRVFADSRPEAFDKTFWQNYQEIQTDENLWQETVDYYQIEAAFISHTDQTDWTQQLLISLYQNSNWRLVYLDQDIVIFTTKEKNPPALILNEDFVGNFAGNSFDLVSLGYFFNLIGEVDLAQLSLEKSLKINPYSYRSNLGLARIYSQNDNPAFLFKARKMTNKVNNWWYKL
ncbi:MAG: hypothetical protein PHX72_00145 [Candidatus Shapirobacteria bacterium]|nr:hypothetical protein [Candidatus Shapirobacteria bacterium]